MPSSMPLSGPVWQMPGGTDPAILTKAKARAEYEQKNMAIEEAAKPGVLDRLSGYYKDPAAAQKAFDDPAAAADAIETQHGSLEAQPGWANGKAYTDARVAYANQAPEGSFERDERYRQAQFLQTPERQKYMQEHGRVVDLLRNLKPSKQHSYEWFTGNDAASHRPMTQANEYFDKADGQVLTRNDYNDPNYHRFRGQGPLSFLLNPLGQIGQFLRTMNITADASKHALIHPEGVLAGLPDGFDKAGVAYDMGNKVVAINPEQPVLDLPDGASPDDHIKRRAEIAGLQKDLMAPTGQAVAQKVWGGRVPAVVGDGMEILTSMLDPTLAGGIVGGLKSGFWRAAMGEIKPELVIGSALNALGGDPERTWTDYLTKPVDASKEFDQVDAAIAAAKEASQQFKTPQLGGGQPDDPSALRVLGQQAYNQRVAPRITKDLNDDGVFGP